MNTKTQTLLKKFLSLTKKDSPVNVYHAGGKTIFEDTGGNTILIPDVEFDWQLPDGVYYNETLRDLNPEFCTPRTPAEESTVTFDKDKAILLPDECLNNLFTVYKAGRYMPNHFTHNTRIDGGFCTATDGMRLLRMPFPFEVEYYVSNDLLKQCKWLVTKNSKLYWYGSKLWLLTEEKTVTVIVRIPNTPIEWPNIDLFTAFDKVVETHAIQSISDLQLQTVTPSKLTTISDEVVCFSGNTIKSYYLKSNIKAMSLFPPREVQFRKLGNFTDRYILFILGDNGTGAIIAPINPEYM
jgi:hypothetical protein